jgi:hypothetical protein
VFEVYKPFLCLLQILKRNRNENSISGWWCFRHFRETPKRGWSKIFFICFSWIWLKSNLLIDFLLDHPICNLRTSGVPESKSDKVILKFIRIGFVNQYRINIINQFLLVSYEIWESIDFVSREMIFLSLFLRFKTFRVLRPVRARVLKIWLLGSWSNFIHVVLWILI